MDILGIDIAKAKFDVHLILGGQTRSGVFANSEAGFAQLWGWLARHRPTASVGLHVCLEATGNWGLDVAAFLHGQGQPCAPVTVSIVNPARIKAYGASELARNKTDRLDAGVIARFCRAQVPPGWQPPASGMRELRELVRRCEALKVARTQELNRRKSGFASDIVAASIDRMIDHLDTEIAAVNQAVHELVEAHPDLRVNRALLRSIIGIGDVVSAVILAELPNIAEFTPKGLAAFAGLSPQEHSSGSSVRGKGGISRMGSARLRSALYLAALSAKRHNPRLAAFGQRMREAGKAPKLILIAVARRILVYAHAVIRSGLPFDPSHQPQHMVG
jgi:transposase